MRHFLTSAPSLGGLSLALTMAMSAMCVVNHTATGNAGTVVNGATYSGCTNWSSPGNATASDNVYTSAPTRCSNGLRATNFGFSLPNDATIVGIETIWEGYQTTPSMQATLDDYGVVLRYNGSDYGTKQSRTVDFLGSGLLGDSIGGAGGSTFLWGASPTYSEVNSSSFGYEVDLHYGSASGNPTAYVDQLRMKIYYTTPTSPLVLMQSRTARNVE